MKHIDAFWEEIKNGIHLTWVWLIFARALWSKRHMFGEIELSVGRVRSGYIFINCWHNKNLKDISEKQWIIEFFFASSSSPSLFVLLFSPRRMLLIFFSSFRPLSIRTSSLSCMSVLCSCSASSAVSSVKISSSTRSVFFNFFSHLDIFYHVYLFFPLKLLHQLSEFYAHFFHIFFVFCPFFNSIDAEIVQSFFFPFFSIHFTAPHESKKLSPPTVSVSLRWVRKNIVWKFWNTKKKCSKSLSVFFAALCRLCCFFFL